MQLLTVFLVAAIAAYLRFHTVFPKFLFGDDLANMWGFYDGHLFSTPYQALFSSFAEKYRPITSFITYLLVSFNGMHLWLYQTVNIMLQGINSVLFFMIACRATRGKFLLPFLMTIVFATSRFALFQVTQITGLVESCALIFFFIMLFAVSKFIEPNTSRKWHGIAILAITCATYTHERYIVAAVWLGLLFTLLPNDKNITLKYRCLLVLTCVMVVMSNAIIKVLFFHIHFFVGTGGVRMFLDKNTTLELIREAFLSLLGFNQGPQHLVGYEIPIKYLRHVNHIPWLMAIIFSFSWFYVTIRSIFISEKSGATHLYFLFGFLSLMCFLLIPPVFTIRMEPRWDYAPFALLLLSLAWAFGSVKHHYRSEMGIFCILAVISLFILDTAVSKQFNRIYMVGWGLLGNAIKTNIIDVSSNRTELVLYMNPDECETVKNNRFFEMYEGKNRTIYCAQDEKQLKSLHRTYPKALALQFDYKRNKFIPYKFVSRT